MRRWSWRPQPVTSTRGPTLFTDVRFVSDRSGRGKPLDCRPDAKMFTRRLHTLKATRQPSRRSRRMGRAAGRPTERTTGRPLPRVTRVGLPSCHRRRSRYRVVFDRAAAGDRLAKGPADRPVDSWTVERRVHAGAVVARAVASRPDTLLPVALRRRRQRPVRKYGSSAEKVLDVRTAGISSAGGLAGGRSVGRSVAGNRRPISSRAARCRLVRLRSIESDSRRTRPTLPRRPHSRQRSV